MRRRIVEAAQSAISAQGYAGTSVRSIAAVGGFSPAVVFYHFGSVDALLLAVLDSVTAERLTRYRARLHDVASVQALAAAMSELYTEDLRLGQLTAVQEIVGAMAFDPGLGAEILTRMQPWIDFAAELAGRLTAGSPLAGVVDPAPIGSAVIALHLGLEIVARMRGGDTGGSRALVDALEGAAPWLDALLRRPTTFPARRPPSRVRVEE
jgi:AcrR family transcriptional regulator